MPNTIRIRRRAAGGAAGPPPGLANAELAYNEQNDTLYYGKGGTPTAAASIVAIGGVGFQGPPGPTGPAGPTGPTGPAGQGVPVGGAAGQVLAKNTATNYDTGWITPTGGGITDAPSDGVHYVRQNAAWASGDAIYQPLDGDLTSLAAASGINVIYYRSAANTWATVTVGAGLAFSAGTLAGSLFSSSAQGDVPSSGGGTVNFLRADGSWAIPPGAGVTPAALTKTDDTNVTLTLGGSPSTALINAASITVGWAGTLAASRLNALVVQAITNDTNITGSIAAQTLTLGFTGTLAATRLNANVVQAVVNDTNVTGAISAQTLTLGWTGTLANARLANMAAATIKGNNGASAATPIDLTAAQINAMLPIFTTTLNGLAPSSGGGTVNFLRADGSWAIPPGAGVTPAALTKTDDTNVTLTLGGSPSTALINAASITVGWAGTLAAARLNGNVVQSVVNDTNVTGSISAQALTLGWTGLLAAARFPALTGDVTTAGGALATTLATVNANVGTFQGITVNAKGLVTAAANQGYLTGNQSITLSGDVTGSGATAITATIANAAVTYAKMQNVSATSRFLGRITAGAGSPEELTAANAWAILGVEPAANFPALTGDVTTSAGSLATTIANAAVTNAKLANAAANSIKGNNTGAAAAPIDMTGTQATALLDTFTTALKGLVPSSGGGTTNFLRADATWAAPPAGGATFTGVVGQCQLVYTDTTHVTLQRFDGSKIRINGAVYDIPAAGVAALITSCYVNGVAAQALANSTTYNVYVFNNAGTLTLDFSTTARAADTTAGNEGTQIKSGDPTRTLVGKVYTAASGPQFSDTATYRGVLSWFNRLQRVAQLYTNGNATSNNAAWVDVSTPTNFLSWGDSDYLFNAGGVLSINAVSSAYLQINLDNATLILPGGNLYTCPGTSYNVATSHTVYYRPTEGRHFITVQGQVIGTCTASYYTQVTVAYDG